MASPVLPEWWSPAQEHTYFVGQVLLVSCLRLAALGPHTVFAFWPTPSLTKEVENAQCSPPDPMKGLGQLYGPGQ